MFISFPTKYLVKVAYEEDIVDNEDIYFNMDDRTVIEEEKNDIFRLIDDEYVRKCNSSN